MEIKTQKDLEKLIRMLRKEGVEAIKIDNIEMHLGKLPLKASNRPKAAFSPKAPEEDIKVPQFNGMPAPTASEDEVETDGLTEEQLLMWSTQAEVN